MRVVHIWRCIVVHVAGTKHCIFRCVQGMESICQESAEFLDRVTTWSRCAALQVHRSCQQCQRHAQDAAVLEVCEVCKSRKLEREARSRSVESWIYRFPDLSRMFLSPGTEKTVQGHEFFIPGTRAQRASNGAAACGTASGQWGRTVSRTGEQQGKLILICAAFFSEDSFFCRGCFFKMPFPWHRYKELKEDENNEYCSLKLGFGRNSRHP